MLNWLFDGRGNMLPQTETCHPAWLLRHPAGIQPIIGTCRPDRIRAACQADSVEMSRDELVRLYIAARGRRLP